MLFNRGAEEIFGYTADEILGEPLDRLVPERFRAAHHRHFGRFASSGVTARNMSERAGTLLGLRKNGDEFPFEATLSKVEAGRKRIFAGIVADCARTIRST